jgi:endonuclease III
MQTRSTAKRMADVATVDNIEPVPPPSKRSRKGQKKSAHPVKADWDILPHGLGRASSRVNKAISANEPSTEPPADRSTHSTTEPTKEPNIGQTAESSTEITEEPSTKLYGRRTTELTPALSTTDELGLGQDPESTTQNARKGRKKLPRKGRSINDENNSGNPELTEKIPRRTIKKGKDNPYGITPGFSPFPEWITPSADACEEVHRILADAHSDCRHTQPQERPAPSLEVAGCGEVPAVLDALIRTLLSGATSMANSNMAIQGLHQRYGVQEEGSGKGSVDWNNVRLSSEEDLIEAIKRGGLAKTKAKHIKLILDMVYEENQVRRAAYLEEKETGVAANVAGAESKTQGQKDLEIFKTERDILSLDHIYGMTPDEAMRQFTKYPGIGVKTASCVILFCLGQPSFAVDTHVWRMCKWLKWVPEKASPDETFGHCNVHVPNHLKYGLHQLFIWHGKNCGRCRANTSEGTKDWDNVVCPLEHLLTRGGKRKSTAKPTKKKADLDETDEKLKAEPADDGLVPDIEGMGEALEKHSEEKTEPKYSVTVEVVPVSKQNTGHGTVDDGVDSELSELKSETFDEAPNDADSDPDLSDLESEIFED